MMDQIMKEGLLVMSILYDVNNPSMNGLPMQCIHYIMTILYNINNPSMNTTISYNDNSE